MGGAAARRSIPFPPDFRYTVHDWLFGGVALLVDDSNIPQAAPSQTGAKVAEAINYLWPQYGGSLPSVTPDVTADVNPATDDILNGYSPSDCSSIDRLDLEWQFEEADASVLTAHLVGYRYYSDQAPTGTCVIACHGHGMWREGSYGVSNLIQAALSAGHDVITTHMVCQYYPHNGNTEPEWTDPPESGHSWLASNTNESATYGSRMAIHRVLPIACANLVAEDYDTLVIAGLSGGGWTAAAVSAIDGRFAQTFVMAGCAPMWLLEASGGDDELIWPYWYELLPYPTQFAACCSGGRTLWFGVNEHDNCCYSEDQYLGVYPRNVGRTFDEAMDDFISQLTTAGCLASWWLDVGSAVHQVSAAAAAEILSEIT
jgi:hypothetical protein